MLLLHILWSFIWYQWTRFRNGICTLNTTVVFIIIILIKYVNTNSNYCTQINVVFSFHRWRWTGMRSSSRNRTFFIIYVIISLLNAREDVVVRCQLLWSTDRKERVRGRRQWKGFGSSKIKIHMYSCRGLTIVIVKSSSLVSAMVVRVPSSGVSKFCHSQAGMCVRSRVWPTGVVFKVFGRTSA